MLGRDGYLLHKADSISGGFNGENAGKPLLPSTHTRAIRLIKLGQYWHLEVSRKNRDRSKVESQYDIRRNPRLQLICNESNIFRDLLHHSARKEIGPDTSLVSRPT